MNRRAGGALATIGAVAVTAAVTAGAALLPGYAKPAGRPLVGAEQLPITSARPSLVCPGPETLLVPAGGQAVDPGGAVLISALAATTSGPVDARVDARGPVSAAAVTASRALPSGGPAPVAGSHLALTTPGPGIQAGALALTRLGPVVVQADSASTAADQPTALAAVQSTRTRSGDLRGLATTTCSQPQPETWLVGGSTTTGARLRLLLSNPAGTPAVVDVEVLGPKGLQTAPSVEGLVVPAGREVPVTLDALAPGLAQVAVHVTARTGRVVATLEESLLRGLAAGGVDDVPAGAGPAREQVIPGVSLVDGYGKGADDPTAAGSTFLRIAVPGAQEAVVQLHLVDSTGTVELPQTSVVTVPAGGVTDVPIAGVSSGTYTAVVEADTPVVAGVQVGRAQAGSGVADFGWAGAAGKLGGSGYLALPPADNTLSLAALKAHGRLDVTEVLADGSLGRSTAVSVPRGTGASLPLSADAVGVRISALAGGPIYAAVVATVDDHEGTLVSVLPVTLTATTRPTTRAVEDPALAGS